MKYFVEVCPFLNGRVYGEIDWRWGRKQEERREENCDCYEKSEKNNKIKNHDK